jgi:predicted RNA-binding protein (virulence factor B family)
VRHAAEQEAEVDAGDRDLVLAADLGVHRDQVVPVAQLQAVAGVVQDGDRVLVEAAAELAQRVEQAAAIQVLVQRHQEAGLAQGTGDQAGVVHRVVQRVGTVGGIADHQGQPRLGDLGASAALGRKRAACQQGQRGA